eukprot:CAMPEP_0197544840 /NCGR_PEP_ID=MMETSP1320-20131121/128_1 /TAXON_ID=91990 /ORGANISM="Bolidomonas sp., Strain RCC2347" /LENGTH=57 /DNA_ID=CAMNT_0043104285 /DNA_START=164 /DNA_END=337 /DNA_ORIENTATION=+
MGSPVFGLRPARAERNDVLNVPKPNIDIFLPEETDSIIVSITAARADSASDFVKPDF